MIKYNQIVHIYSISKVCNDPELLELLNAWRGITNVILEEDAKFKFQISRQFDKDFIKWGNKPLSELKQIADILYRIINIKAG